MFLKEIAFSPLLVVNELDVPLATAPISVPLGNSQVFNNFFDLKDTLFVYSMSVEFTAVEGSSILRTLPEELSSSCVLLLLDESSVVGSSEIVRV